MTHDEWTKWLEAWFKNHGYDESSIRLDDTFDFRTLAKAVIEKIFEQKKVESTLEPDDKMLFIKGQTGSFHCSCGCNVFHKFKESKKYKCNGCDEIYIGEAE